LALAVPSGFLLTLMVPPLQDGALVVVLHVPSAAGFSSRPLRATKEPDAADSVDAR